MEGKNCLSDMSEKHRRHIAQIAKITINQYLAYTDDRRICMECALRILGETIGEVVETQPLYSTQDKVEILVAFLNGYANATGGEVFLKSDVFDVPDKPKH